MSSLTLKGKPSEQASLPPINSGAPLASTASNASSGIYLDYSFDTFLVLTRRKTYII